MSCTFPPKTKMMSCFFAGRMKFKYRVLFPSKSWKCYEAEARPGVCSQYVSTRMRCNQVAWLVFALPLCRSLIENARGPEDGPPFSNDLRERGVSVGGVRW